MFNKIRLKLAFKRLKNALKDIKNKEYTPQVVMTDLFDRKLSLIQPWQYQNEFSKLLEHYYTLKPTKVMEIGTANGGTLFAHCKLANNNATVISVDLPGGNFGGGYPDWKIPLYNEFAKNNQKMHLIRASSHDQGTFELIKNILKEELLDYIFIDGDHTYNGVKKDFELYYPLVKVGGTIAFHDIALHKDSSCQVDKFWREIKSNYKHIEFLNDQGDGKFGIGIIIK